LCKIEACLNSRPLYTAEDGIDQQEVLTVVHFLIGGPPLDLVEPMTDEKIGNLDRWKLIQKITRKKVNFDKPKFVYPCSYNY